MYEDITIDADRNYVFYVAQDYDLRLDWDPFLLDIAFKSEIKSLQRGLVVWVKAHNGMEMTVKYLNYKVPDHVSMKMVEGPWIFSHFSGMWKFEDLGERTSVIFSYRFSTKWFLFPGSWLIKWFIKRDMKARLHALKQACEQHKYEIPLEP